MADKNVISKDHLEMDTKKEETYQRLISLMKSIRCMTPCHDKIEMYHRVAKQLGDLSGYKESEEYRSECIKLAKQTQEDIKQRIYSLAVRKKNSAKLASDYRAARDEFRRIPGYLDANELALECDKTSNMIEKKFIMRRVIISSLTVLVVILAIVGASLTTTKYYFAKAAQNIHAYETAIITYQKLGNYKDSEERLIECQYQNGLELAKEGSYKEARKAFAAAGNYRDSDVQKVKMEKLIIRNAKPKDNVKVGDTEWRILELQNDRALLMKRNAMSEMPYHDVAGNVTWETSSIRKWLNSEYLEATFSEEERKQIILSDVVNNDNVAYGTDGGNDTKDYLFLLSIEECEQYQSLFPEFKNNFWLRSPGHSSDSAAFLSVNGQIMDYGYIATCNEMMIRPIFWFKID